MSEYKKSMSALRRSEYEEGFVEVVLEPLRMLVGIHDPDNEDVYYLQSDIDQFFRWCAAEVEAGRWPPPDRIEDGIPKWKDMGRAAHIWFGAWQRDESVLTWQGVRNGPFIPMPVSTH